MISAEQYLWDLLVKKAVHTIFLIEVGHGILLVSIHLMTFLPQDSHMSDRPQSLNKESASSRVLKGSLSHSVNSESTVKRHNTPW